MRTLPMRVLGILIVILTVGGCSATHPVVSEWRNPAYASSPFKRILVGGLGGNTSIRRNFEDEFVAQLRAAGMDAVPSYRFTAGSDTLDEAKLKQTAKEAGADALLYARLVQVDQRTDYVPSYYPYTSFGVFGPHIGASWYGFGGVPSVYLYNEYVSETTLYDVGKSEVVWTATIKTTEPDNVPSAIKSYVETVIKKLQEQHLLRGRNGI